MALKIEERTCVFGAAVMFKRLNDLKSEIDGVVSADDLEFVHRMRVASRRLRNTFAHFHPCFSQKKMNAWQKHIRQVTKSLGAARDLDVQIEALKNAQHNLEHLQYRPGIHRLQVRLQQRRDKIQPQVIRAMNGLTNSGVLGDMEAELSPLAAREDGSQPYTLQLYQVARQAINLQLESLYTHEALIFEPDQIEALHAMRIDAKRLRYTLEIFAPLYPGRSEQFIRLMKNIQEILGNIHDCDVWITSLPEFITAERTKTRKYYGTEGPFNLLLPGINGFLNTQKALRSELYTRFIDLWQTWKTQGVWEELSRTIEQPVSFTTEAFLPPAPPTQPENPSGSESCEQP